MLLEISRPGGGQVSSVIVRMVIDLGVRNKQSGDHSGPYRYQYGKVHCFQLHQTLHKGALQP
jgi:hypothetical protein